MNTRTPQPLGWTKKGRPIWPVCGGSDEDPPKTFTQDELDRIVGERLARERAKLQPPEDYDELKQKAARLDELEAAQQTELERIQQAAADAEARAERAEQEARNAQRGRAVLEAASGAVKVGDEEKRFVDPAVALRFVPDDLDHTDADAVSAALGDVLSHHPYLAAGPAGPSHDFESGPRPTPPKATGLAAGAELAKQRHPQPDPA